MIDPTLVAMVVSAPVVLTLVQVVKMTGIVASRLLPLVSVLIGLAVGLLAYWFLVSDMTLVVTGFFSGLAATGLWESITKPVEYMQE